MLVIREPGETNEHLEDRSPEIPQAARPGLATWLSQIDDEQQSGESLNGDE